MTRRKSKAGRPPLDPAVKRSVRIRPSVTPALAEQIERAAAGEGSTVNDWAIAAFELAIARGSTR